MRPSVPFETCHPDPQCSQSPLTVSPDCTTSACTAHRRVHMPKVGRQRALTALICVWFCVLRVIISYILPPACDVCGGSDSRSPLKQRRQSEHKLPSQPAVAACCRHCPHVPPTTMVPRSMPRCHPTTMLPPSMPCRHSSALHAVTLSEARDVAES